jgi:hypothetical protein
MDSCSFPVTHLRRLSRFVRQAFPRDRDFNFYTKMIVPDFFGDCNGKFSVRRGTPPPASLIFIPFQGRLILLIFLCCVRRQAKTSDVGFFEI